MPNYSKIPPASDYERPSHNHHYHTPRRENLDRREPRPIRREVVVIHHNTISRDDPARTSTMSHNRWSGSSIGTARSAFERRSPNPEKNLDEFEGIPKASVESAAPPDTQQTYQGLHCQEEPPPKAFEDIHLQPPTDEGYMSITKSGLERVQGQELQDPDGPRTTYSDTSSLASLAKEKYISELADGLFNTVQSENLDDQVTERITSILSNLLSVFALKLGNNAASQMHRDVMVFVLKHRRNIAENFRQKCYQGADESPVERTDDSDKISLSEHVGLWLEKLEEPYIEQGELISTPFNDEQLGEDEDEASLTTQLLAYRELLSVSPAYEWLLENLQKEFSLAPVEPNHVNSIKHEIIRFLPASHKISRRRSPESYKMVFEVDWDPLAFIKEQGYKEEPAEVVEKAITLTGSTKDAQALTCKQYLCQTWPSLGEHLMQLVKDVVNFGPGYRCICTLPDDTKVAARLHDSKFIVEAIGIVYALAEVGELLGWLGATLRTSIHEFGVASCYPLIQLENDSHEASVATPCLEFLAKINFKQQKEHYIEASNGQCWHNMFRNPLVVQGYPIPRRTESKTGLEVPMNMMAGLIGTQRIHTFNTSLFIKGFSAMLVPAKRIRDLLVWHLIYNKSGNRISFLDNTIDPIETIRAANMNYAIQRSRLPKVQEGCILKGVSISRGHVIMRGDTFAMGHKDVSIHISRNHYVLKLRWVDKKFVVMWDEKDERGWLVNGTSALLHLLRASLEYNRTDKFNSAFMFDSEKLNEGPEQHSPNSASWVLLNNKNLKIYPGKGAEGDYTFADRVEQIYDILEKIIDHQIDIAGQQGGNFKSVPRRLLEGWNFKDVASGEDLIAPRMAPLHARGRSWVDLTRSIHAITLFGRDFGELIQPLDTHICNQWIKLPAEGHYLGASVSDLKSIMEVYGDQYANPMKLTDSIIWYGPDKGVDCGCQYGREHSDPVQTLLPAKFCRTSTRNPVILEDRGAVIFGHNANSRWHWKDIGDPVEEEPINYLAEEELETDFYDSGIGQSLPTTDRSGDSVVSPSNFLTHENYKIGIICALQKELMAVRALFDSRHSDLKIPYQDTNHYALGRICQHNIVAACQPSGEYGTNSAASVVSHMVRSFPAVKYCLLVGIGGGVPSQKNDIRLGDVVVCWPSETHPGVIQYDLGKVLEDGILERTGSLQRPPRFLMTAISSLMSDPDLSPTPLQHYIEQIEARRPEYKYPGPGRDQLFASEYVHDRTYDTCEQCNGPTIERIPRASKHPNVYYGLIASGNQVMKTAQLRDRLEAQFNILCFEMEAAGVVNSIPCVVIRGICDYVDSHKNKIWQEYASAAAAAYAKLLLSVVRD